MKRFSDLGVTVDAGSNIFQVQQVSITDILNSEIEVLDFESGVRTQHGENRYVVKIKSDGVNNSNTSSIAMRCWANPSALSRSGMVPSYKSA